jgi:hypothetical protein
MFKEVTWWIKLDIKILTDTGFIGIKEFFRNAEHPKKQGVYSGFLLILNNFVTKSVFGSYIIDGKNADFFSPNGAQSLS